MFLLVAFMLLDNMLKFLSVQCLGHSISSGDRTEIVKYAKRSLGVALIYFELILVIFPLDLKMYYLKNIVVFSMDHPCGL